MWLTFSIQKSADRNSCRRVENEMEPTFWDIAGPIALLSLPISLVLSIYFFLQKEDRIYFYLQHSHSDMSFITLVNDSVFEPA